MILANLLKKGDTVGVIAPSNAIEEDDREYINKSIEMMESEGLKVIFGKHVYSNSTGYGPTAYEKAQDVNEMFENKDVKAIFCVKGGQNSNAIFEYLDYEKIKSNPKILCGFSDSTSILNIINAKTELITFNGPTFKSLSSWETDFSFKEVVNRFILGSLEFGRTDEGYKAIKEGKAEGQLVGGNLSLTYGLTCGKYSIDFTDKILFIEELGWESSPELVSNHLAYMKQNGVFEKIKGIWIGNYTHESGIAIEKILLDTIGNEINFPIIKSENFGHIDKKTIIPVGTMARIDTSKDVKIELIEECLKKD